MARWQRPASTIQVAAAAKDLQVTAAAVKEDLLSMCREKKTAKGGQVDWTREKKGQRPAGHGVDAQQKKTRWPKGLKADASVDLLERKILAYRWFEYG
jgi:hypothetical protein